MNEEQKNIETCLAENILSEVASVPTDPQFRSLIDEALDPLKQQALQQAGYDSYKEVVMYHQPYTFTSQVKQMKSNLILLLRRLWRYPFGRGNNAASDAGSSVSTAAPIRSLADMWQHYITRLKGNPEYGIPSRLSQLTDLPSAPALLADRDISSGIRFGTNPLPDGMSIAQLLCSASAASSVTEIVDTNVGWDCKDGSVQALLAIFPNTEKLTLGMGIIHGNGKCIHNNSKLKGTVSFPALKRYGQPTADKGNGIIYSCPNVTRLDMSAIEYVNHYSRDGGDANHAMIGNMQGLYEIDFGNITTWIGSWTGYANFIIDCPKSGCLKFKSVQCSMNLMYWNPSVALDASRTDLIEEGSTATNNLQQFLQNFRSFIAERLTDKGTGLTLTLSQEVRNAIHAAEDEYGIENIIITKKGWTISPAPN